MILSYNAKIQEWTHEAKADQEISFGFNKMKLPPSPSQNRTENCHKFTLKVRDGNVGPLIGIMTAMSKKMTLSGNGPLFHALQSEVKKRGGMIVVFTPETLLKESISGLTFLKEKQKWITVKTPLPHVVYNRVPFRKAEQLPAFTDAANYFSAHEIPFFNPAFINKNQLYSLFCKHPTLRHFMPESIEVSSYAQLSSFLDEHQGIYLKPASSSRGIGIFRLRMEKDQIQFTSHSLQHLYPSMKEFWKVKAHQLLKHEYIAQKEIIPSAINGKRFDFRVHAHDNGKGYRVTGIGIRQSKQQDLTTHLPNGGVMLPYETVRTKEHDHFFSAIVKEIGSMLTEELGYFGEFSLDAGISDKGDYIIYEVNAKPMSFDEPHIEAKRISALADLFFRKSGFD